MFQIRVTCTVLLGHTYINPNNGDLFSIICDKSGEQSVFRKGKKGSKSITKFGNFFFCKKKIFDSTEQVGF